MAYLRVIVFSFRKEKCSDESPPLAHIAHIAHIIFQFLDMIAGFTCVITCKKNIENIMHNVFVPNMSIRYALVTIILIYINNLY